MSSKIVPFISLCSSIPESTQLLYREMVALGGGVFRGIQPSFRDKHGNLVECLILFDDAGPDSPGSSMALRASEVSSRAICEAIRNKREEFEIFAEKSAVRVFSQFAETR